PLLLLPSLPTRRSSDLSLIPSSGGAGYFRVVLPSAWKSLVCAAMSCRVRPPAGQMSRFRLNPCAAAVEILNGKAGYADAVAHSARHHVAAAASDAAHARADAGRPGGSRRHRA